MTILKIEKNVPMPGTGQTGRWKELAAQMRKGDSVVVQDQKQATGLTLAIKQLKGKAMQRIMRRPDGEKELRVWRVK
jgi:hypothetical protein